MLTGFFLHLKSARLPVSTREFLTLLEALQARVVSLSLDDFYVLARTTLIKDETQFDRYDLAFASYFRNASSLIDVRTGIPEDWLRREFDRLLSDEDRRRVEALGGWDKLMQTFRERLAEQKERHAGGSKWIGTGGTSPFGAYGYNPEGIRVGQEGGGSKSAVKVWDERSFRNLDGDVELNTRNLKVALRKLRRFAREGAPEELDLDGTIRGTARNAGWLDLKLQPSDATASRCCCSSTSAARWIRTSRPASSSSRRRRPSSATSSTSISTTAPTTTCGATTRGGATSAWRRSTCCTATGPTGGWCSSATRR